MQYIINAIGKPKFNWGDIITIYVATTLYGNGSYSWGTMCFVIGAVLSVILESKVKD